MIAQAGFEVRAVEVSQEALRRGLERARENLERIMKKGKITKEEVDSILSGISGSDKIEGLDECFFVVEAVPEDVELKKRVFSQLDLICSPNAILASNTSTIWITSLAGATRRPERVIETHFLYPAPAIPLVEVIKAQ